MWLVLPGSGEHVGCWWLKEGFLKGVAGSPRLWGTYGMLVVKRGVSEGFDWFSQALGNMLDAGG